MFFSYLFHNFSKTTPELHAHFGVLMFIALRATAKDLDSTTTQLQGTVIEVKSTSEFYIDDGTGVALIRVPEKLRNSSSTEMTNTKGTTARGTGRFSRKRLSSQALPRFPLPAVGTLVNVWVLPVDGESSHQTFQALSFVAMEDWNSATLHMLENCTSPTVTEASNKNHVQGAVSLEDKQRAVEELGNLNDLSWKWSQESS